MDANHRADAEGEVESNSRAAPGEEAAGAPTAVEMERLREAAADGALGTDGALNLLKRADLPSAVIEELARNANVARQRKVRRAIVEHPKTPRHISLPLLRQLYTFDLMQVALAPVVPADVKLAADQALCVRMETISVGEKLSLARRGSGNVAGTLLLDADERVVGAALQNSRLTEVSVVKALMGEGSAALVEAVGGHPQWSLRRDVRVALLRNEHTSMARAVEFSRTMSPAEVREILRESRLAGDIKEFLLEDAERREKSGGE